MSTQPISSSALSSLTGSTSSSSGGGNLSNSNGLLQITGLASGLDTNTIVNELMSVASQPMIHLQNEQTGLQALNTQLTSLQTTFSGVATDAEALGSPSLFATQQTVTSGNPAIVSGTTGQGAGVGAYEVSVTQLANSAQRTFNWTSPAAAGQVTIDGHQTSVSAGESIGAFVNSINSDPHATVYAAQTSSGVLVLSNRATGDTGTNFIQVAGASGILAEQTSLAKEGQNALFSVDGQSGSAMSNTVTNAIPGVSLTLGGLTTTSGPVTVTVGSPAANTTAITNAVNQFVKDYNAMIDTVHAQLTQAPVAGQPSTGVLYNDQGMQDLLTSMRQSIYSPVGGLTGSLTSLGAIGISTGAASGSSSPSQSAIQGKLTVDPNALAQAVQSDPAGVRSLLQSWSIQFSARVNTDAGPGGTIDSRISGDSSQLAQLSSQISGMQATLGEKQHSLTAEFAQLENSLSTNQSTAAWLTGQIASLPG
jgi:flagellar hook-associated protein 2